MSSFFRVSALAGCLAIASVASAQEQRDCSRINRSNLIPCTISASLAVRAEEASVVAVEGRRTAVSPVLPSNPVLALSGARRTLGSGSASTLNWSAELSQELEIAGQRRSRIRATQAELDAQNRRVILSKRDAAFAAWTAYFDELAAKQEQSLASRLLSASERMSAVARGKAEQGLIAAVDADVADVATLRVLESKLAAERAFATASAQLLLLVGRDAGAAGPDVDGELVPLSGIAESPSTAVDADRPETRVFDDERRAQFARAEAFRRSRVPNPTLSVFAQNDGFDERVYGLGIAFPIPLPSAVGRSYAGEIAEAEALGRRADLERARVEREIRLEVAVASAEFAAHRQVVATLTPQRIARAESSLIALGQEIEAGRLSVREALIAEQALIELLQTNLAERRALCLASVRLARALGVALEEGTR